MTEYTGSLPLVDALFGDYFSKVPDHLPIIGNRFGSVDHLCLIL